VNLLGFIPFGMILAMMLRQPRSLLAFAAMCGVMSLSIETGQVFLASRTPSVDDLLLNTLGGALGAWLGLGVRGRISRLSHPPCIPSDRGRG
jgi:glycopeptide antibiotics resistance protein